MQPLLKFPGGADRFYHVTPDELDLLVTELSAIHTPSLRIDTFRQHSGRNVYALTFGKLSEGVDDKRRLFVSRPHAHEPAGTAACTELAKVLAGYGKYGKRNDGWRTWVLENFVVTLVPDANPGGSQNAPVKFWDGKRIPNEEFFLWMFGESGEKPGERFPRVDSWDRREATPPAKLGIAYEQIDEYTYVEPNRDYRSTFFQSYLKLEDQYRYEVWLDLHQTEFLNSDRNAVVHLPTVQEQLPAEMQRRHRSIAEAIHARWKEEKHARPVAAPVIPYRNNEIQRKFLSKVWKPIVERLVHLVTEVQNNSPQTPVGNQVHLQIVAVLATLEWMASAT